MKFNDAEYAQIEARYPAPYDTYEKAIEAVYAWVVEAKITPAQMAELTIDVYKHFVY